MKKTFKRAGIAVLSMSMLLSMGAMTAISSNAAGETITVASTTGFKTNDTVTFYKVAQVDGDGHWQWINGASNSNVGTTMTQVAAYDETTNAAELKALASKLERLQKNGTITDSSAYTATVGGSAVPVAPGYYLGIANSTDNSLTVAPVLVAVAQNQTATVSGLKTSTVSIDKKIKSVSDGTVKADKEAADVAGDADITYTIVADIPNYDAGVNSLETKYTITDISTDVVVKSGTTPVVKIDTDNDGDFDGESALTSGKDYTYTANPAVTNAIFSVALDDAVTLANGGKKVQVEFVANLAADYNMMATGNNNKAQLDYSNNYATGSGKKSINDNVDVYTAKLTLDKKITDDTTTQEDFNFTLKKYDGSDYVDYKTGIVVKSNGTTPVEIKGLPTGNYKIVEDAVANYKPLSPIQFDIVDSNVNGTFTMKNESSEVGNDDDGYHAVATNTKVDALPGTGGMGTILFTVGGAAVVLLAGALFVVYMRKRKVEE